MYKMVRLPESLADDVRHEYRFECHCLWTWHVLCQSTQLHHLIGIFLPWCKRRAVISRYPLHSFCQVWFVADDVGPKLLRCKRVEFVLEALSVDCRFTESKVALLEEGFNPVQECVPELQLYPADRPIQYVAAVVSKQYTRAEQLFN